MDEEKVFYTIILRHDTSTNWMMNNPILALSEYGVEDDTHRVKRGDGQSNWADLPYEHFGLEYLVTFENLIGEVEDNKNLKEALSKKVSNTIFTENANGIIENILLKQEDNTLARITRVTKDVVTGSARIAEVKIISKDNSIQGIYSIDDEGIRVLNLQAYAHINDYEAGKTYYVNELCYNNNRLYRCIEEEFVGEGSFNKAHWVLLASLHSSDIKYDNLVSGMDAENVKDALDELKRRDDRKVQKSTEERIVYGTDTYGNQTVIPIDDLRKVDTVNHKKADLSKNVQLDSSEINYSDANPELGTIRNVLDSKVDKTFAGEGAKIVRDVRFEYNEVTGQIVLSEDKVSPETGESDIETREIDVVSEQELADNVQIINDRIDNEVETLNTTIENNKIEINQRVDREVETLNTRIDNEVEALNTRIDNEVDDLNDRIDQEVETLNATIETTKQEINTRIDNEVETLNNTISTNRSQLDTRITNEVQTINNRIDQEVVDINVKIDSNKEELQTNINTVQSNLNAVKQELQANIDTVQSNLDETDREINERIDNEVETLNNKIDSNKEELQTNIDQVQTNLNNVDAEHKARFEEDEQTIADNKADIENKLATGLARKINKSIADNLISDIKVATQSSEPTLKITYKNTSSEDTTTNQLHFSAKGNIKTYMRDEDHIVIDSTVNDETLENHEAKIDGLDARISAQQQDLTSLETRVSSHDVQISNAQATASSAMKTAADTKADLIEFKEKEEQDITEVKTVNANQEAHLTSIDQTLQAHSDRIQDNADSIVATNINVAKNTADIADLKANKIDKAFSEETNGLVGNIEIDEISGNEIFNLKQTKINPMDNTITTNNMKIISSDNTVIATILEDGSVDIKTNLDTDVNYFVTTETLNTTIPSNNIVTIESLTPTDKVNPELYDIISDAEGTWARIVEINDTTVTAITFHKHAQAVWGTIKGNIDDQADLLGKFNTVNETINTKFTNLDNAKVDKTAEANKVYGTDEEGNQITYNKDDFGKVDTINNIGPDENKNVTITGNNISYNGDVMVNTVISNMMSDITTMFQAYVKEGIYNPTGNYIPQRYVTFEREDGVLLLAKVMTQFQTSSLSEDLYENFIHDVEEGNLKLVGIPEQI